MPIKVDLQRIYRVARVARVGVMKLRIHLRVEFVCPGIILKSMVRRRLWNHIFRQKEYASQLR